MKRRSELLSSILPGLAGLALGALMLLVCVVSKNWLIIVHGVRTFKLLQTIAIIVTAIGALITIILSIPLLKTRSVRRREQKQQDQFMTNYAEDDANPELTRQMLIKFQRESAGFNQQINQCLAQMDRMDELQASQKRLLQANAALYLSETEEVLNQVERWICRNVRNIINLCIAAVRPEQLSEEQVDKFLRDNESKLKDASELIRVSVERINQYALRGSNSSSEVKHWIEVIRESLKED